MEERRVEVSIISAENLEDVNRLSRMKTYAVARVSPIGYTHKTKVDEEGGVNPVDEEGGVNPYWPDGTFHFTIPEAYLRNGTAKLTVEIWTKGTMQDREVGEVMIPLTEAPTGPEGATPSKVAPRIYTIRSKATGEPRGQVHVGLAYGTRAVHGAGDAGLTVAPIVRPGPGSSLPAPGSAAPRVPEPATHASFYNYGAGDAGLTVAPIVRPGPGSPLPAHGSAAPRVPEPDTQPSFYYYPPPPRPQPPPDQLPSYHPPPSEPPSYYPPPSPSYPPASLPPPDSEPHYSYYPPPSPSYHPRPPGPPSYYPHPPRTPALDRRLPVIEPPFDDHKPFIIPSDRRLTPTPPHNLSVTSPPGPGTPGTAISVTPPPYVRPPTSTTGVFSSPVGKMLLTESTVKIKPPPPY